MIKVSLRPEKTMLLLSLENPNGLPKSPSYVISQLPFVSLNTKLFLPTELSSIAHAAYLPSALIAAALTDAQRPNTLESITGFWARMDRSQKAIRPNINTSLIKMDRR